MTSLSDKILYNENEGWQYLHLKVQDIREAVRLLKKKLEKFFDLDEQLTYEQCEGYIGEIFGSKLTT